MSSQTSGRRRRTEIEGALVVSNRVDPDVPDEIIHELLDEGIVGLLDFKTGRSVDPNDLESTNYPGRGAFGNFAEVSRVGSYLISFTEDFGRVIVSRAGPSSIRFVPVENADPNGGTLWLKCIDTEIHADVDEDEWEGVFEVVRDRHRNVFGKINDADHRERVVAALTTLEREGKIQRS